MINSKIKVRYALLIITVAVLCYFVITAVYQSQSNQNDTKMVFGELQSANVVFFLTLDNNTEKQLFKELDKDYRVVAFSYSTGKDNAKKMDSNNGDSKYFETFADIIPSSITIKLKESVIQKEFYDDYSKNAAIQAIKLMKK